jgi:hypothetical protein
MENIRSQLRYPCRHAEAVRHEAKARTGQECKESWDGDARDQRDLAKIKRRRPHTLEMETVWILTSGEFHCVHRVFFALVFVLVAVSAAELVPATMACLTRSKLYI